jgi:hypothetical protein
MDTDRHNVFSVIGRCVMIEAGTQALPLRMPKFSPGKFRSANRLTPGELQADME